MSKNRRQPCVFCGYPLSETHHPYKVSIFGRNKHTIQLCANCHEFYHLVEQYREGNRKAELTLQSLLIIRSDYTVRYNFEDILSRCEQYISSVEEIRKGRNNRW